MTTPAIRMFRHITKYCNFFIFGDRLRHVFKPLLPYVDLCNTDTPSTGYMQQPRLQNSPYFCVFKYARAVKQKVWNEAENRERDWGETLRACETRALRVHKALTPLVTDFFTDFEKKTDCFAVWQQPYCASLGSRVLQVRDNHI